MNKMLQYCLGIALFFIFTQFQITYGQSCYSLRVASSNLYLTNMAPALKVQPGNNQPSQIWKFDDVGGFVRITPTSSIPDGTNAIIASGGKGVVGGPYTGQNSHLWEKKFIETVGADTRYGFVSKNSLLAMGVENWGNGNPSNPTVSDINLVSSSDIYTFGANKFVLEPKTCPTPVASCDFNLSVSSSDYNPAVNENFTLTATCSGPGCYGVGYEWMANGYGTSIGGTVQTVSMPTVTTVEYGIRGEKAGCADKTAYTTVYVGQPNPDCDYNIDLVASNYSPIVGSNVTLTANCTGPGCATGTMNYIWFPMEEPTTRNYFTVIAGFIDGEVGPQDFQIYASKDGCPWKTDETVINVMPPNGSFTLCKEAESASDANGAVTSDPLASNGQTRGLEGSYNHYVTYTIENVPAPGTYKVKLRYYSSSAPVITVTVPNTNTSQIVNLPNSGAWNIVWAEQTFNVSLVPGTNYIKIQGTGGGSCRQDKICVTNDPNARLAVHEEIVIVEEERLNVSPNPSNGNFDVDFFLENGKKGDLMIMDMQGKVLQTRGVKGKGNHKEKIQLGSPSGTYLVRILKDDGQEIKKAVIIK